MPANRLILSGSPFITSAINAQKNLTAGSLAVLQVVTTAFDNQGDLIGALLILRPYLARNAVVGVSIFPPPADLANRIQQYSAACGVPVNATSTQEAQIQSDNQKQQMERWKILEETQTKIFEIQQDVTANQAKTQDKAYKKWDEYIRQ